MYLKIANNLRKRDGRVYTGCPTELFHEIIKLPNLRETRPFHCPQLEEHFCIGEFFSRHALEYDTLGILANNTCA